MKPAVPPVVKPWFTDTDLQKIFMETYRRTTHKDISTKEVGKIWNKLFKDGRVNFYYQDNFTVALLALKKKTVVGVSKRSVEDPYDTEVGERIAYARAIKNLLQELHIKV